VAGNPTRPVAGDPIAEDWGQGVADRVIRRYPSEADRDLDLAGFAPAELAGQMVAICPAGAAAYLTLHDGASWTVPAGGGGGPPGATARYGLRVQRSSPITAPATGNTWVRLVFDAKILDEGNCYSTTSGDYTCPVAGLYLVNVQVGWNMGQSGGYTFGMGVYKNGVMSRTTSLTQSANPGYAEPSVTLVDRFAAGDLISGWWFHSIPNAVGMRSAQETTMCIVFMGPP
jgi:hypothetical protein